MSIEMIDSPACEVVEYQPFLVELATIEENNSKLVFDYESKTGNKEARSHIYKLRQSKGTLERIRKEAKAESLRIGKLIDTEAGSIEGRINKMIDVHQKVIDGIEKRETDRIAAIQLRLKSLRPNHTGLQSQEFYRAAIAEVEGVLIDESWQEFRGEAALAKDSLLTSCRAGLAQRTQQDADMAELERLRAMAAALPKAEPVVEPAAQVVEPVRQPEPVAQQKQPEPVSQPVATAPSHKATVNSKAMTALMAGGLSEEAAKTCVILIVKGLVPGVQIFY